MKYAIVVLIVVLMLASLACDESQAIFDRIDGPTQTPEADTCVPDCVALCSEIQEKHGNPPEVCEDDCAAVCEKAEVAQ